MDWHHGPIQEAIATAKTNRKIFLVYIEGKDTVSQGVSVTYETESVSSAVKHNCVAVKLSTESEQFKQFSQIYPVIVVPSSFLIGSDGIPLEVIGGALTPEEFVSKINNAAQMQKSKPTVEQSSSSEGNRTHIVMPQTGADEDPNGANSLTLEEKVARAKQLVEERRLKKLKEEQEEAKTKELEHRRVGQEVQRSRQQQQEREMAEWAQQMKKEKEDARMARERVKAQIAQDKADRAARFGNQSTEAKKTETLPASQPEIRQRSPLTQSDHTRIQFRLPNATNRTHEFSSSAKLQEIFQFIDQTIKPGFSNYTLATTFSRCNYTRKDATRSLTELELVPSAVLLIVPTAGSSSAISSSFSLWPFLSAVLSPFLLVWNLILSFVRPTPAARPPAPSSPDASTSQTRGSEKQPGAGGSSTPNVDSPKTKRANSSYKQDGNVHRFSNQMDDDDENNTWNGNSTQQL